MQAPDESSAMAGVWGAVSFLTQAPVGRFRYIAPDAVARGVIYFPLVGAVVGTATALTAWAVSHILPGTIAAMSAVAVGAVLTGALHLDGLADTADGYGGTSRASALEIMRDHAVGTYGVVALVLDIGLRVAAIAALLPQPANLLYLVAAGALSRTACAGLGCLLPNARAGAGSTEVLHGVGRRRIVFMILAGTVIAYLCVGWRGLIAALAIGLVVIAWGLHCMRRLGGVTGDTLGAASEAAEILVLLVGVAAR
jgi:adenosylcobinamide-GDP ribazoletransferase